MHLAHAWRPDRYFPSVTLDPSLQLNLTTLTPHYTHTIPQTTSITKYTTTTYTTTPLIHTQHTRTVLFLDSLLASIYYYAPRQPAAAGPVPRGGAALWEKTRRDGSTVL